MTSRLNLALLTAAAALTLQSPAAAQNSDVTGLWRTPVDGGGLVRLTPCGGDICGTVVDSPRLRTHPDQRDVNNRDPDQRHRPLRGLRMLRATPEGGGRWGDGWVYNPEDGRTYRGSLRLLSNGQLRLTACVVAPLCRTQTWTKVRED